MRTALVLTTINSPNTALISLAKGARAAGFNFVLVGDTKSPAGFQLEGGRFLDIATQMETGFDFAAACPTSHYARKNIGYLEAIRNGADVIVETDDDNLPRPPFFAPRQRLRTVVVAEGGGWINAYRYFTEAHIWPRGFPLAAVKTEPQPFETLPVMAVDCPIQQGLADENPDVDALYRLLLPLPQRFRNDRSVALGRGAWCPFNSQNTSWWRESFSLLYLPAYCSFRMTDIWRSFVAQRIAWENGWHILFHEPTVWQERNEHNLMRDFADEIPGYLHAGRIGETLEALSLRPGVEAIPDNLRHCYRALGDLGVVGAGESELLEAWLADLARMS